MKKLLIIAIVGIVSQVATVNAANPHWRGCRSGLVISIGVPPIGYYGNGFAYPYNGYPNQVAYNNGYRIAPRGYCRDGNRGGRGYYGHGNRR